jgi:hypothetical protein
LIQRGHQVLKQKRPTSIEQLNDQKPALMILILNCLIYWLIFWIALPRHRLFRNLPVLVMTASPVDQNIVVNQYPCVVEILKTFNTAKLLTAVQRVAEDLGKYFRVFSRVGLF